MRKFLSRLFVVAGMVAMVACGGGGGDSKFETPGGGTGGTGGDTGGATAAAMTAISSVPSIPSDGSASAEITAFVRDANNTLVSGVAVTFTASSGGIAITQGTSDASGAAKATLTTAGDPSLRTIKVTASAGSLTATVNVQVVPGSSSTSVQMGSLVGSTFTPNAIAIGTGTLSAGGSTSLQVALQRSDGTLYNQSTDVTFTSTCIAQGLATVNSPVTTTSGIANATYVAKGCSGQDVITATASMGSGSTPVTATGNVTVAAASVGSVVFSTASVTNIALKGTGNAQHPETSTVIFQVLDSSGGPRANATVTFALNTTVGGLTLNPTSGISDAQGKVQTVVQGGTVATSVRVTATVTSTTPVIATQSNLLTVTTGIPDQDSFSLAVTCPNVEALNRDGVVVGVTARLADRFNNPVPAGTAVTFTTEGGSIQSQCSTGTLADGTPSGSCVANWTSSNPRPASAGATDRAGRSTVLATAIGEESFNDANGNGSFDNGETFMDIGEPFVDNNEDGVYQVGEPIYDFNNNSMRDGPDGKFNGVLCNDTTGRCDASVSSAGISASTLIIMSGSQPVITAPAVPLHVSAAGAQGFTFTFADVNNNPLATGTTISAEVAGTGFTLGAPSSFTYPCATEPLDYTFTVNAGTGASNGTLTITVTAPSGLKTVTQYAVVSP